MSYRGEREMHDATCGDCGKQCQVPFEPRQDKPVYCNECFPNHKPQSRGGSGGRGGYGGGGGYGGRVSPQTAASAATANTGGGGGGTPWTTTPANAGSGVVILRIPTASYSGTTTGSPSASTSGSDTILVYNSSGSYTA